MSNDQYADLLGFYSKRGYRFRVGMGERHSSLPPRILTTHTHWDHGLDDFFDVFYFFGFAHVSRSRTRG